jgi:pullulanase
LGRAFRFFREETICFALKDMDQNSYNSGDWFNKIDWSGNAANWGIGSPVASQNQAQWPLMTPLLSNPAYTPLAANITYSQEAFSELLSIRYSSDLFHMKTSDEVQQNLSFLNAGQNQVPGLIVMKLDANGGE